MREALIRRFIKIAAASAAAALAACSGGGSGPATRPPPNGSAILTTIVGFGDSLTAGYQSEGFLGAPNVTNPVSKYPGNAVPPGQENGWWALFYAQAKGFTFQVPPSTGGPVFPQLFNPALTPLPLIAGPGLGSQLVLGPPLIAQTHSSCDAFNTSAFSLASLASVRLNPTATTYDVAIPGQTAHEAIYQVAPITGPSQPPNCTYPVNPSDPTSGGLQSLVEGESDYFYPVLGAYAGKVSPLTQLNVAVYLHPTLATVWLGANDLLKFTFSGGSPAASDTPTQMQSDIASAVTQLQHAGARVVVANLPNVLSTPQFFQGGSALAASMTKILVLIGLPQSLAQPASTNAAANIAATYDVTSNGYLTESGMLAAVEQVAEGIFGSNLNVTPKLDPNGPGSGKGGAYLPDTFASQVQALNDAYNSAIAAAAQSTGAPLVDIHALFLKIQTDGGIPITPTCCTLQFGGGLLTWDGLHPSNVGYALIANAFIGTVDQAYGLTIPQLTPSQLQVIAALDPYQPLKI